MSETLRTRYGKFSCFRTYHLLRDSQDCLLHSGLNVRGAVVCAELHAQAERKHFRGGGGGVTSLQAAGKAWSKVHTQSSADPSEVRRAFPAFSCCESSDYRADLLVAGVNPVSEVLG